jgi:hypothetical protein
MSGETRARFGIRTMPAVGAAPLVGAPPAAAESVVDGARWLIVVTVIARPHAKGSARDARRLGPALREVG